MSKVNSTKLQTAEARAIQAERAIGTKSSRDAVFEATIEATELYLQAFRLADNAADRRRIDAKCQGLLARAESMKARQREATLRSNNTVSQAQAATNRPRQDLERPSSTRKLTKREDIILLEGSKLNGFIFKPWDAPPRPEDFYRREDEPMFYDNRTLSLSSGQMRFFSGWKRPDEALGSINLVRDSRKLPNKPAMASLGKIDLVQDMTSDCSVVASLCAVTSRAERGHAKILGAIIHPYDHENDVPLISSSGKYVLRLRFNGCWRKVEVDDLLPTSSSPRLLHVIDRSNPGLLWPALVEKAYLKVRGGYDFPGSNSGTDLAVITGWIPQQIFLHDEEIERDDLWSTVLTGFQEGSLLFTMGTGKLPKREQRLLGLAAEHDYAVLEMKEEDGIKEMLIKNPWSDGDVWRGATKRKPNQNHELSGSVAPTAAAAQVDCKDTDSDMTPGTFWMDFSSVFQHFENLYLNWNPELFQERQDLHFAWDLSSPCHAMNMFIDNPQFMVQSKQAGKVWLLLNRHFKTGEYSHAKTNRNGYISLYLYHEGGRRVLSSDGSAIRGPFVDSPNTLLTFNLPANCAYTAVIASQNLQAEKYNFSLSAFSDMPVTLAEAATKYPNKSSRAAAWTRSTAGGNFDSPRYLSNPQFVAKIRGNQHDVAFVLSVESSDQPQLKEPMDVHVKILVVFSDGRRITRLRSRDIVAHSGDYRRGSAVIETTLAEGNYTVICSTFEEGQLAKFTLTMYTSSPSLLSSSNLTLLPPENSGRLSIVSPPALFANDTNRLLAPLTLTRVTKAIFVARCATSSASMMTQSTPTTGRSSGAAALSLFRITLEQGQGPYKRCIASSATLPDLEFSAVGGMAGLRIEDTDLRPDMHGPGTGGLWLVLERLARATTFPQEQRQQPAGAEALEVEILADERVELGAWGHGDG